LTPWFASSEIRDQLFTLPGPRWTPVPIVVVGHFDDPKADECRPAMRTRCQDRFVIDRIVEFDPKAAPSPTPSPSQTPFPVAEPPAAPLTEDVCFTGIRKAFVGWTRVGDLGIKLKETWDPNEYVYALVTLDEVPIGDPTVQGEDTWHLDPTYLGHKVRWWGRQVCFAQEASTINSGTVEGSTFLEIDDGRHIPSPYPYF